MWAIGVITYFLLCGYTPFDRDTTMEEMQAIINADYSFEPAVYWQGVSEEARDFVNKLLTIDPSTRMTAHQALQHPWLATNAAKEGGEQRDLLPDIKHAFNAKRTFKKAVNGIRLINRLRTETADVSKEEIDELQKGIEEAEKESANVKEVLAQ